LNEKSLHEILSGTQLSAADLGQLKISASSLLRQYFIAEM